MSNNLYVDFHVLQTVPPSCVNRDDTGSPKTAVYGGKTRARVSSQAWKRAIRETFKNTLDEDKIGYRTKKVKALICNKIMALDPSLSQEKADEIVTDALKILELKSGDDKKDVLFFISAKQVEMLAKMIIELQTDTKLKDKEKKEKLKLALREYPSVDLALFGRMAANDPSLNYDAAAQVAHSISTHAVSNEYDYFTAVDDCAEEDNAGAGHLGTVEFNSSTLYRYATVNVNELREHLDTKEAIDAVIRFADAFVKSMPTGKQNTFANRTLPDLVYVTIRIDQPINLVNAFEKPVVAKDNGYIENSKEAFQKYVKEVYSIWTSEPEYAWVVGKTNGQFADEVKFSDLLKSLCDKLTTLMSN